MERKLKLLRIFLIPLFALLLACGVLLCVAPRGVKAGATDEAHTFVIGTADENSEGVTYEQNLADGWSQAVALSLQLRAGDKPNLVKVVLSSDWIAADLDGETSFGLGDAFYSNTLYVPGGAKILLDLNGYIVNRNLTTAVKNGSVFTVAGELTLADSRPEAEQYSLVYDTEDGSEFVRGGVVTGGNITENGGAVLVLNSGNFTLSGGTLFENTANVGGGIYVGNNGKCTVDGGSVFYNAARTLGGGVYAERSGSFTMNGGSVSGNIANYGGGVAVSGVAEFNGGTIQNNSAVSGGGVYAERYGWIEMTGGYVRDNRATETGGGVEVFGTLTMDGGSILGNTARWGGGVSVSDYGTVLIDGESVISGNTATDGAGALVRRDAAMIMDGGSISGNTAKNRGGGVFLEWGILDLGGSVTENSAVFGGGVEVADDGENVFILDGSPVIENNGEQNLHLCGEMLVSMGKLGEEASVYVSVEENYAFAVGYVENNLTEGASYGKKPSLFFTSDNPEQKIILNDSCELVMVPVTGHPVNWTVTYADGSSEGVVDEYGISIPYGEHAVTGVYCNGDGENYLDGEILQNAGEYMARSYTFGSGVSVRFTVSIQSRPLDSEGVLAQFTGGETPALTFTGKEQTPAVELLYNGLEMVEGRDYTLAYENNLHAGTAYAVVYGEDGNNFKGELKLPFTIAPSTEIMYGVRWEYRGEDGWAEANALYFQARDLRGDVRAVLFAENAGDEIIEYVYAEGFDGDTHPNLTLVWNGGGVDARDYTVTITGTPNGVLAADKKGTTVTIHKATLPFTAADFTFEDENRNRLWVLDGGSQLRDKGTVYFDPDAAADEYGNTVTVGTLNDAYARFRGEDKFLELVLNGAYEIGGTLLSSLSAFMQVNYSGTDGKPTNRATGAENAVTEVQTKVTITFGDNYELGAGGNTLVLEKTWYIVVINNGLLGADGGVPDELSDMVYGNAAESGFRPEHGEEIIYTVTAGAETLFRFAAVVNSGTQYYGVKETDGVICVDYSSRIYSDSYLNQCLNRLSVGGYTLTMFVPQQEADGVTYYAFTQAFPFRVLPCSIGQGGAFAEGLSYFLLADEVVYNGKSNNTPRMTVVYDRKTLREGVDFALSSTRVNVGAADLTVRGIGNYSGEVFLGSEVFHIVRATNDWVYTPSVIGWEFGGFEKETNRFQAAPALLDEGEDVWFGLFYDAACLSPVANLAAFNAVGGVVSNTVAERLRALPVGMYYVKTWVRETQNYTGLEPAANALTVERAANDWVTLPTIIGWNYAGYDKNTNLILASVLHGGISFRVTDADGNALTEEFTLSENGLVSASVADILFALPAGSYRLTASVSFGESYLVPATYTSPFAVGQAVNGWEHTPSVVAWVQGQYGEEENPITAGARFGKVQFRITAADDSTRVLYDSAEGINLLNEAGAGLYMLSAYVADGDANYTDLSPYMVTFRIFAPAGMPWWGTLLIVVGVLGVIALVFFILQKKGVLQVLSGKMVVAIRAKAAADATIAAVRANKKAEEAKASIARAENENADISDGKEV